MRAFWKCWHFGTNFVPLLSLFLYSKCLEQSYSYSNGITHKLIKFNEKLLKVLKFIKTGIFILRV